MLFAPRNLLTWVLAAAISTAAPVLADDGENEHDGDDRHLEEVSGAVGRGEIRPLADILQAVQGKLSGEVVGVEVEREDGHWLYELRVAEKSGRLLEVYVDAATAQILKTKVK